MQPAEIPPVLFNKLPIEESLKLLGFHYNSKSGLLQCNWGPIEVDAGPWIWDWKLIITINIHSRDIIYVPQELSVGLIMRPIDILVIIYSACDSLFQKEEPPQELKWGKIELKRYREERRQEYESRPKVWAEKDFFRFCINYLEKRNDWSSEDYDVTFSHADGQLKLKAKDDIVFCPAIGTFNGTLTISARQLFRRLPKRFLKSTVFIQVLKEQKATIASHLIPACWIENPAPQDKLASYAQEVAP